MRSLCEHRPQWVEAVVRGVQVRWGNGKGDIVKRGNDSLSLVSGRVNRGVEFVRNIRNEGCVHVICSS